MDIWSLLEIFSDHFSHKNAPQTEEDKKWS